MANSKKRRRRTDARGSQAKGRNSYDREESRNRERDDGDTRGSDKALSSMNDISWYSRNPNLLQAAGSFPYPYRPGSTVPFGDYLASKATETSKLTMKVPGFMSLAWAPSVGSSAVATDPASVVSKEVYAKVREKYSGNLEADAPDFTIYLMAIDSIYSYIAWLKRLYRIMNVWTPDNYAIPDTLLNVLGLRPKDILSLRRNRVQLWQCINELILQTRKFACPAVMDIFNRHYWMSDNVYTDAPTINSQMYLFNLVGVLQFDMLPIDESGTLAGGLKCVWTPWADSAGTMAADKTLSVDDLYDFGISLINALVEWDDAYTINGYLTRAYEGVPTFTVAELQQDEVFAPVYVEEVLTQIENSRTVPMFKDALNGLGGFSVTQRPATNAVISNPTYVLSEVHKQNILSAEAVRPMLSIRSDNPTVADSVIATRLQATITHTEMSAVHNFQIHIVCGTEIPLGWFKLDEPSYSDGVAGGFSYVWCFTQVLNTTTTNGQALADYMNIGQYDWHPFVFYIHEMATGTSVYKFRVMGDTHNVTTISKEDLENLHRVCVYSEFNAFSA
nr:putative capsid [Marmot picobirnavirus]